MAFSSSTTSTRPFICASWLTLLRQWQVDDEFRAAARLADDVDASLVGFDDLFRDGHPEPGALVLGGEERIKDAINLLGGNGAALVTGTHGGAAVALLTKQLDPSPLGDVLQGVNCVVQDIGE